MPPNETYHPTKIGTTTMNKLAIIKFAARFAVGSGTSVITKAIIENNVTPTTKIQAITVPVAAAFIGAATSSAMKEQTDSQIDEIVANIEKIKTLSKKAASESTETE